jgi:hypothetical protein
MTIFRKNAPLSWAPLLGLALVAMSGSAGAEEKRVVSQGGGLPALSVEVDLKAGVIRSRTCQHGTPCDGAPKETPIDLPSADLPSARDVSVDDVPVGDGKHVAHVRIPSARDKDVAFEAILAASDSPPIFQGRTGYFRGTPGDREGSRVTLTDRGDGTRFIVVSRISEALRLCGDPETPDGPTALDPKTLELRRATLRLPHDARDAATPIVAVRAADGSAGPLVSPLFSAVGSGGTAAALVDGDPRTSWVETRPNDGRGEFVTARALANVAIRRLRVVVAQDPLPEGYSAPRVFFVKTTGNTFAVTLPEDAAMHPGASYDVPLPAPLMTECLSVVLDESYAKKDAKAPNVGIAEVLAYTQYDVPGASLADVVAGLSGQDGAAREAAKSLLGRAGKSGVSALEQAYPKLDADGRIAAMDVVMSSMSCTDAGDLLVRGYVDSDKEVSGHGEKRLLRCGRSAGPALGRAWEKATGADAARLGDLFATLAPDLALAPIGARLGVGSARERASTRAAFAVAARNAKAEALGGVLDALTTDDARIELLRAAAPRIGELGEPAKKVLEGLGRKDDFRTKWLILPAFAVLAESSDPTARAWLVARLGGEKEWPLRARAAELWPKSAAADVFLARACEDPSPRVREAVLRREGDAEPLITCAQAAILRDPWPFVRVAGAHTLARAKPSTSIDATLAVALADKGADVRIAAATALGDRHASSQTKALLARLSDGKEDSAVRVAAAHALGNVCAGDAVPKLTELANDAALPQGAGQDVAVAISAVLALGAIHPADLATRLAPLLQKGVPPQARAAAQRALADPGSCQSPRP